MSERDTRGKQIDLIEDYGQHGRETRKLAMQNREPLIEKILISIRNAGEYGRTRDELAFILSRPIQSICRPVLDLLRDEAIIETAIVRKTRWGRFAAVLVEREHTPPGGKP
jgi:hypothetical protein